MTSQRKESPPRRLTAVNQRGADARALRAARGSTDPNAPPAVGESEVHVPAFLMASPPSQTSPPSQASPSSLAAPPDPVHQKAREELIAEAAYRLAASRGFEPGHEWDDWLAAEKLVDTGLGGPDRQTM